VISALARARQTAELAELVGAAALSQTDRSYLDFQRSVEDGLFRQGSTEARGLEQTLTLAWQALAVLPRRDLSMLSTALIEKYLPADGGPP